MIYLAVMGFFAMGTGVIPHGENIKTTGDVNLLACSDLFGLNPDHPPCAYQMNLTHTTPSEYHQLNINLTSLSDKV